MVTIIGRFFLNGLSVRTHSILFHQNIFDTEFVALDWSIFCKYRKNGDLAEIFGFFAFDNWAEAVCWNSCLFVLFHQIGANYRRQ